MSLPTCLVVALLIGQAAPPPAFTFQPGKDFRDILNGHVIPDEGYCDQPYVVVTKDGHWLCTLTTGRGEEGARGQHIVATISTDQGRTWSDLIDIEPANGPDASWAMPLITPTGRVYVFYSYNGDHIDSLGDKKGIRADMLGWFVYKYSDDNGRTWSSRRYRIPIRETEYDRTNDWQGKVQIGWSVGKPIIVGQSVYVPFSKIGKYLIDKSEGWFFRSDNFLSEPDPSKHTWEMLPDGDIGLRSPEGPIAEEQNLVSLSDGSLFTVYRTVAGHPCHAYSRDNGRTWTPPAFATYTPGGRLIKHPRACPRLWKASNGKYLLWFHNHGGKSYPHRNPAWISGGLEKDGFVHWSQPEIMLYDPNPDTRISYPDLIEQDGRYWVTATQKTVARIHEIDPQLLDGLWAQGTNKTIAHMGLALDLSANKEMPQAAAMPRLPSLDEGGGFSIDLWLQLKDAAPDQTILDTRDEAGKGLLLATGRDASFRLTLSDGRLTNSWESDPGTARAG
ncbi:MAG TPA: sialidase family protein, partial [Phycisphaerae bacterium]|nr:sialidase family protein [Phycisphaerae bacterium]